MGEITATAAAHERAVWSVVAVSGSRLASGGADGEVRLWTEAFDLIAILGAHTTWVVGMTWTGQELLSVSNDGLLKVWDIDKEAQTRSFKDATDELYCCMCVGPYMAAAGL